ncbi:MAG: serine hydrolase [Candidatus Heimdallarchaeota archaeon]|nr:MAG: serine hydrolase [Candidatus Heimdallarchaeota archaeon]
MKKHFRMIILIVLMAIIAGMFFSSGFAHYTNEFSYKKDSVRNSNQFTKNFATLTRHGGPVWHVAFSPDDSMLASASADGSIRLWNITNGETIHLLQGHYFHVYSADFSLDGSILASAGWNDQRINFWNVSTGKLLNTWHNAFRGFRLKFSPIEKSLLAYPQNNSIILRNVTDGTMLHNLTGHSDLVWSVAFSPNGSLLASSSADNSIKLWDRATGLELRTLSGHTDQVYTASFSSNNSILASGGPDETIRIWNVNTGALLQTYEIDYHVFNVDFSPTDPDVLISSGGVPPDPIQSTPVQLWNITEGEVLDELIGHTNTVVDTAFSHDGTILASCGVDRTIKLWGDYPEHEIAPFVLDWPESTPAEQGLDAAALNQIPEEVDYLDSFLIIRHGKLVFEEYYTGSTYQFTPESRHMLFSVTKSFTSALIGIAIEKGFIQDVDQKVLEFFPDMTFVNVDSQKEAMTLEHLLTMTTGLEWNDGPDHILMARSPDALQYVLDLPMENEPGTVYNYNTGASHVLSAIIQETTGNTTVEFAQEYLFEPLGIHQADIIWMTDIHGRVHGGNALYLTPRNMAKFGQLYLNNGSWNGQQIVPADWVAASTRPHVAPADTELAGGAGYGYQWWTFEEGIKSKAGYSAVGADGQIIYVMPEEDIVVITTSERWRDPNTVPKYVGYAIEDVPTSTMTSESTSSNTTSSSSSEQTTTSSSGTPSTPVFLVLTSLIIGVIIFRKRKGY